MTVSKTIGLVLGAALLVLSGLSAQTLAQVEVNIGDRGGYENPV
jgi:hypothetical protein